MIKKLITLFIIFSLIQETKAQVENDSIELFDNNDFVEIKEVLIQAQRKKMNADKAIYTFDKEALEKARYAKDLLNTLPELQIDFVSNTIKSTKGGITLILINGIESTDMQIRGIKPANVVRVEYFDIPPARWANRADQVVNIITNNPENGYVVGVEYLGAFSTGFLNGSAYANVTRGKHNFSAEYSINLRDYDNRENNNSYRYFLNSDEYFTQENRFDHFGYTFQDAALRYTTVDDKYSFQAKLSMDFLNDFSYVDGTSLFAINKVNANHTTFKHKNSSYIKPTIDLYYSRNLSENDELIFNFVGSKFNTESYELSKEWVTNSGLSVFNNEMNLKASQTSIVGEISHIHKFKKGSLGSGARISTNKIDNELKNLVGETNYKVNYVENYFYSEYADKVDKFSYRIGLGLTNIHNKSAEITRDDWTFSPKIVLGYELNTKQNIRLSSTYFPTSPWSDALSSNVVQMVPNIVRKGNPYLEAQKHFDTSFIYSFNSKYFDLNTSLRYLHKSNAINEYFVYDAGLDAIALTYENADYSDLYRMQISGAIKPFGNDLLTLKVTVSPTSQTIKTSEGKELKKDFIGNNFNLTSVYKNFTFTYQLNFPIYSLDGAFLSTNENNNHLFLSYKLNDWSFTTGMFWIGMPSEYKTKSLDASLVNYTSHTQIWNNKNMFVLGLSYDFATGKRTNMNKKLNNNTADAASF